ncbi:MAG: hypothetical protein GTN36_00140 [Candidatus Aenigmarchaeota archaeon]|nr:hypothetical protein [Candidatus Aenigmarchaeota archaeon]
MTLKQFLKPDWKKIVLTIVLMIFPLIFMITSSYILHSCPVGITDCSPIFDWEKFLVTFTISIILSYILSCLLIWGIGEDRKLSISFETH